MEAEGRDFAHTYVSVHDLSIPIPEQQVVNNIYVQLNEIST